MEESSSEREAEHELHYIEEPCVGSTDVTGLRETRNVRAKLVT